MSQSPSPLPTEPVSDPAHWFVREVHPHEGQLKSWLRHTYPSVRDIDDVVQESYVRVWRTRITRPIESAKSFLFTVARHLAVDELRRHRASPIQAALDPTNLDVSDPAEQVADQLCREERCRLLAAAIVSLPARMREVVILHKIDALPQAEIARRCGISPKTVENLIGRGVQRCREFLERHSREPLSRR